MSVIETSIDYASLKIESQQKTVYGMVYLSQADIRRVAPRSRTNQLLAKAPVVAALSPIDKRSFSSYRFSITTTRMSSANCRTRSSLVSQEHMKRAPPTPMKV